MVLPEGQERILGIKSKLITRVFVACDILSFLIQSAGIGVASSQNWDGEAGINTLITGLSTQLATNVVFIALVVAFYKKTVIDGVVSRDVPSNWKSLLLVIMATIILILIRSLYRLIEFALGFHGYPFTHEWTFYVLEAVPMLVCVAIYCIWFPAKYLNTNRVVANRSLENGKVDTNIPLKSTMVSNH